MLIAERTADLERRQSLVTPRDRIIVTLAPIISVLRMCAGRAFRIRPTWATAPSGSANWRGFTKRASASHHEALLSARSRRVYLSGWHVGQHPERLIDQHMGASATARPCSRAQGVATAR
jgi:hypothetical protein